MPSDAFSSPPALGFDDLVTLAKLPENLRHLLLFSLVLRSLRPG